MKTFFLLLSFALSAVSFAWGQSGKYLIKATPHLNMRAEPRSGAKIVGKAPNLSLVEVTERHSEIPDTIGELVGFWFRGSNGKEAGWMFSPFMVPVWVGEEGDDAYELLSPGNQENGFSYDPTLNWLGVFKGKDGKLSLEKVKLEVQRSEIWFNELDGEWVEDYAVSTDDGSTPEFLVGSRSELPQGAVALATLHDSKTNALIEGSPYPYQTAYYAMEGKKVLYVYPEILRGADNSLRYAVSVAREPLDAYQFSYNNHPENLIELFSGYDPWVDLQEGVPAIIWAGDLNRDGIPELITIEEAGRESCGYHSWRTLFMSNKSSPEFIVKVAED